jgi:hypothetical protein
MCTRRGLATAVVLLLIAVPALAADTVTPPTGPEKRPAALVPLYIAFTALQVLDAHSTLNATTSGADEANPMMRSAAVSPTTMLALKAAATTGVVMLSEKLWRRNRAAAVLTMIGLNTAYAVIAAHNYSASHSGTAPGGP